MTNKPTILVVGRTGQVGWELRRALAPCADVVAVDYPEMDLTSPDSIRSWVRKTRPRVVINAAAYTAVDKAETETDRAMAINGTAPGVLAEEAQQAGAWMVHYSTDYVFDGAKTTPYTEEDPTHPIGAYGRTKLAGDEAVRAACGAHLIFRLCWVYGLRGQNFLLTMQRLARERELVRVVADQFGCPTWSRLIAETTVQAVRQVLSDPDIARYSGTYHLASSSHTSWHGFADAIIQAMPAAERKCQRVEAIGTQDYPTPARRPAWSVLGTGKLLKTFGLQLPSWDDALRLVQEP